MRNLESRRQFLKSSAALTGSIFLGDTKIDQLLVENKITRIGTLTSYSSDRLMDEVIANRFGLCVEYIFEPQVRSDISALSSIHQLKDLNYWGKSLIENPAIFSQMSEKIGNSLSMFVLQGISSQDKSERPFFIAPDTYNFYPNHAAEFIGSFAYLETTQEINELGQLVELEQPRVAAAMIMDVRDIKDHWNEPTMLSDADPSTISWLINTHWNSSQNTFLSGNGSPVQQLPTVKLTINRV